ncbi:hypothetical protein FACS189427_01490 [Planctomycetales bacterium]|nr:hypothetical protein FACS189427_01490 [Planctomycetales bacterium]
MSILYKGTISIFGSFFRSLWSIFRWGLLLFVVAAAALGVYALIDFNQQLKDYILAELDKRFEGLDITIGSVHLDEQRGISIRNLECSLPVSPGLPKRKILTAKELYVECPVSLRTLYECKVKVHKIVLKSPCFRLTRNADGQFTEIRQLIPHNGGGSGLYPVEVEDGTLLYEDLVLGQSVPLLIDNINAVILPPEENKEPVLNNWDKSADVVPSSAWKIAGKIQSSFIRQLNFTGYFLPEQSRSAASPEDVPQKNSKVPKWAFAAECRQFDFLPKLLGYCRLQRPIGNNTQWQRTMDSSSGYFNFVCRAASAPELPAGFRFELNGELSQGKAELQQIQRTISDVSAKFAVSNDKLIIEKITGLADAARFVFNYSQEGFLQSISPQNGLVLERKSAVLTANIRGLLFDDTFVDFLSPFLNDRTEVLLNKFDFGGTANLEAQLRYGNEQQQNKVWKPDFLDIKLSELAFSFKTFPYKLERLGGRLTLDSAGILKYDFVSRREEAMQTKITGQYSNVFIDPAGQTQIRGQDVPIDNKLAASLPEEHRNIIRTLHPNGKINAELFIGLPPGDAPLDKRFNIVLNDVSVKYDKFPYPLQKVTGWLNCVNDEWTFGNLSGTNGAAVFQGSGFLKPAALANTNAPHTITKTNEFQLTLHADNFPVNDQLLDSLPSPEQRELLTGLRANGKIQLDAAVRYFSHNRQLDLEFKAVPCAEFSIKPDRFPYKIDNLSGEVNYKNGTVSSERLKGNNRSTKFSSGLHCRFSSGGQWELQLPSMYFEELKLDNELLEALPPQIQKVAGELQTAKPLNVSGSILFSKQSGDAPLLTVWNTNVIFHQNNVQLGFPVSNVFGNVQLSGYSEDSDCCIAGYMNLDSAMLQGFQTNIQTTRITGPFFYDGRKNNNGQYPLYIGQRAMKSIKPLPDTPHLQGFRSMSWFNPSAQASPVQGELFDGRWFCEGLVFLGNNISYSITTLLQNASLTKIAAVTEPNVRKTTGTLSMQAHFYGNGKKTETLGGQGKIELRDANIYEAPVMMQLLRELSIRQSDSNAGAFRSIDVNFFLQGNRVILDPLVFEGDVLSLTGNGEMRLDSRNINLVMKTRLGNRRTQIPLISEILGGAGDQIVQLSIEGPLASPAVRRVLLPEIQKAVQQIQGNDKPQ